MSTKKTQDEDAAKVLAQYLNAVWMDFDNVREQSILRRIVRRLSIRKSRRRKH